MLKDACPLRSDGTSGLVGALKRGETSRSFVDSSTNLTYNSYILRSEVSVSIMNDAEVATIVRLRARLLVSPNICLIAHVFDISTSHDSEITQDKAAAVRECRRVMRRLAHRPDNI